MTNPPTPQQADREAAYLGAITPGAAFIMDFREGTVEELVRIADVQPADHACCKVRLEGTTFWLAEFDFRRRATPVYTREDLAHHAQQARLEERESVCQFIEGWLTEPEGLCAAIRKVNQMRDYGDWRPIKTAPKDGSTFIVYSPDSTYQGGFDFAEYDTQSEMFCKYGCGWDYATHWMPLPAKPTAIRKGEA